jgi:hypothetical protein
VLIATCILGRSSIPWLSERPWIVLAWVFVATLLPIGLEAVGVLPSTWSITDGRVVTTSTIYDIRGDLERFGLLVADLGFLAILAVFSLRVGRDRREAQRRLHVQAWHLSQLLPGDTRSASRFPVTLRESRRPA